MPTLESSADLFSDCYWYIMPVPVDHGVFVLLLKATNTDLLIAFENQLLHSMPKTRQALAGIDSSGCALATLGSVLDPLGAF